MENKQSTKRRIYLATAYTGYENKSFDIANKVAAELIKEGHYVFSPISMSHPIAELGTLDGSWNTWKELDMEFIRWCEEVVVINFGNDIIDETHEITKSVGVQDELKYAIEIGKSISYHKV
jgi:hypothetical protein